MTDEQAMKMFGSTIQKMYEQVDCDDQRAVLMQAMSILSDVQEQISGLEQQAGRAWTAQLRQQINQAKWYICEVRTKLPR